MNAQFLSSEQVIGLQAKVQDLERQLAEAQGERRWLAAAVIRFLDHRGEGCGPMYGCECGAFSASLFAARILSKEGE